MAIRIAAGGRRNVLIQQRIIANIAKTKLNLLFIYRKSQIVSTKEVVLLENIGQTFKLSVALLVGVAQW